MGKMIIKPNLDATSSGKVGGAGFVPFRRQTHGRYSALFIGDRF